MNEPVTITICILTGIVTHLALINPELMRRLLFKPKEILRKKQYDRLFSSALIHADWMHAGFNLFALYSFGSAIELLYGWQTLLAVYVLAILGGSLLSLYLHRFHDYAALGASGGVSGVIFATIFLVPGTGVGLIFLPIFIPGNVFALLYLIGSFWGLRKGVGNIGHDAHFGGAIAGLVFAFVVRPDLCLSDPIFFWGSVAISAACLAILYKDPENRSGTLFP